ncbi:hypothetical protein Taro_020677 [Colocasia esculenta]|uniref:DDE Tnp4 domain-containing protein n=1 Tax=Colocasia esculenta TaxID=4460 RepID=A0A843V980_COLES|nr:hypothetical protein [Colocasia esculenta]
MDPSVLLMLSNLLHLHNHLDPLLSDSTAPSSATFPAPAPASSPCCSSSSPAPLLFLAIASVLSYASSALCDPSASRPQTRRRRRRSSTSPPAASSSASSSSSSPSPSPPPPTLPPSDVPPGLSAFQTLSSDRIWSMDPAARDARWRSHYGLSYPVFANLVDHLRPHLRTAALPIPADYAISVALARLSRGLPPRYLARHHQLSPALVSKATNAVTRLLSTKLYPDYVRIPAGQRLLQTIQSFRDLTSLPNMCGAIDGSPIKLRRAPPPPPLAAGAEADGDERSPSQDAYQCRHGYPAVLLQVVADARKIFWDVCVKAPGSSDDVSHFRDSVLYSRLTAGEILRDAVVSVRGHHVRPYIVGDWAYPLMSFLLTPFTSDGNGTPLQNAFDSAVMKGRAASVEAALGLLKGRWRILRDLNVGINHAAQTIVACCVLHNMCQIAGEPEDEDVYVWRDPKESAPSARALDSERSFFYFGESLRQAMADDLYERQQRLSSSAGASRPMDGPLWEFGDTAVDRQNLVGNPTAGAGDPRNRVGGRRNLATHRPLAILNSRPIQ